jgi:hypothetical protein
MIPNKEYLNTRFIYQDDTLYWKTHQTARLVGRRVMCSKRHEIFLDGKKYNDLKIKWVMLKDEMLPRFIGFKDLDANNRSIENLISTPYNELQAVRKRLPSSGYHHIYVSHDKYDVWICVYNFREQVASLEEAIELRNTKYKDFGIRTHIFE